MLQTTVVKSTKKMKFLTRKKNNDNVIVLNLFGLHVGITFMTKLNKNRVMPVLP